MPAGLGAAFQTCSPRSAGSRRAGERAAESSFPASDWKAGPCSRACSWQPGARGPAATSSRGGDVCAPGARAATEPRLCRRGARPGRRPAPSGPGGWASAGSGRDPGGDPKRSLGPAGRRWRAGCGGDPNLFRGNETVTVGRGSISQACPPSLTSLLVPGPTRTACALTATVKAGWCQHSARAHTRGAGGGTFFKK